VPTLHDSRGRPVALGREIGRGGEGAVFEIAGDPAAVAKVYHDPVDNTKVDKLTTMSRLANPNLLKVAAWPTGTLHARSNGALTGIILPKIVGHRDVHQLYCPAQRKVYFPTSNWSFLIHVAMNVAGAFETIHQHGHVIGDVNQGGVLVSAQKDTVGTVQLIDCDSFQVRGNGHLFHCVVGVPQYTPPEMVGANFRTTERTQQHDCFGLALLIFHLLFMGRHPYAGRFSGGGDMTIERAISEGRFAFSQNARSYQMAPPPNALTLDILQPPFAQMFERSFARGGGTRPVAGEWWKALKALKDSLRKCADDTAHVYPPHMNDCPWCRMEAAGGPAFFVTQTVGFEFESGFAVALVWGRIQNVTLPTVRAFGLPPRPRNLTPAPVPPDAMPDSFGKPKAIPSEPRYLGEPLPPIPIYAPELLPDRPPFDLEPVVGIPQFAPEVVPGNPALQLRTPATLPEWNPRDYVAEVRKAFKRALRFSDYNVAKRGTLFLLPVVIAGAFYWILGIVAGVIWLPFLITWIALYVPRRRVFNNYLHRARGAMARQATLRDEMMRRHELATKATKGENARLRTAWDAEIIRLETLRSGLTARNAQKHEQWKAELERVKRQHVGVAERNSRHLREWEAHVKEIEARRIAAWEDEVRKFEAERERLGKINASRREQWQHAVNHHREIKRQLDEHNARIASASERLNAEMRRRHDRLKLLEAQIETLQPSWASTCRKLEGEFSRVMQSLEQTRQDYFALKSTFEDDRKKMSQHQAVRQSDEFLKTILLEDETIEGIGKGRKATLEAYGIETAFDITEENVASIPGFGPTLENKLLSWRMIVEARFKFDPTQALTPTDLRMLHMKYHTRRNSLQRTLQGGDEKLLEIRNRADKALQTIQDEARRLMPLLAQAEVDLRS